MKEEIIKYLEHKQKMHNRELSEYLMNEEDFYDQGSGDPFDINNEEYAALYSILQEDIESKKSESIINNLRSINENLRLATQHLSVIKGIMIFTLIVSIVTGIITACSVLS